MKLCVWKSLVAGVFLVFSMQAHAGGKYGSCIGPFGGGGEVPSPHAINTSTELADGEHYLLQGNIVDLNIDGTQGLYFKIDLEETPWLANKERVRVPYYPLEGAPSIWAPYMGKSEVRLAVVAHGRVRIYSNNTASYIISLSAD